LALALRLRLFSIFLVEHKRVLKDALDLCGVQYPTYLLHRKPKDFLAISAGPEYHPSFAEHFPLLVELVIKLVAV